MHIGVYIRFVVDTNAILVKEFSNHRGIGIGLIRSMVFYLKSKSDIQFPEPECSFITYAVAGKDQWK